MIELANGWFSTRRGTEAMDRGYVKEDAVTVALLGVPCVIHIVHISLMARGDESYFAASPDGVVTKDVTEIAG